VILLAEPLAIAVTVIPSVDIDAALDELVFEKYGIGDLADVEGARDRVVKLSPESTVVCPLHGFTLLPDCCRSCRFLCGEVRPD
jgi:hypothetical protein